MTASVSFDQHHAYFVCEEACADGWTTKNRVMLPVDDLGVRQGIIAVERLRTYQGSVRCRQQHLQRFAATRRHLGIVDLPSDQTLSDLIDDLLERNADFRTDDIGITLLATPGHGGKPTWAMHLNQIDHAAGQRRRNDGQTLVLTDVVSPPSESWSRQAKVRSRIHYFHADTVARRVDQFATGCLRDADGSLLETSIANIAIRQGATIVSPPPDQVLHGVTQAQVCEIAKRSGMAWTHSPLDDDRLQNADEVWLMGTDTGLWYAHQVNDAAGELVVKFDLPTADSWLRRVQAILAG